MRAFSASTSDCPVAPTPGASFVPRANTTSTLAHESSAAEARADHEAGAANEQTTMAPTASVAKMEDSAARTVNLPILTTKGVTVLMIWFPFSVPLVSLQCLSDALPPISQAPDLGFRGMRVIYATNGGRVVDEGQLRRNAWAFGVSRCRRGRFRTVWR